jgi:Plasmid encoded RepA protein
VEGFILPATEADVKKASEIIEQLKLVPDGAGAPEAREPEVIKPEESPEILYQHTVFCQTCFPYKDPGDHVRTWERQNGKVYLHLQAGTAFNPFTEKWQEVGLPYGPKARLVLAYLNSYAIKERTPVIEAKRSFTSFVKQVGLISKGDNITVVKDQLTRLTSVHLSLAFPKSPTEVNDFKTTLVETRSLRYEKGTNGRLWWPENIVLTWRYFESLLEHAVPLKEEALMYLGNSAMALDIYTWLAQRLHRVNPRKPMFVPWDVLYKQFGTGYTRERDFRDFFTKSLGEVLTQYTEAKVELSKATGLTLRNSLPPVRSPRILIIQ